MQDLRTKLFPPELEKRKAVPDPAPSTPSPAKQKERSLSSLVDNSPEPAPQPSMAAISKYPTRKSLVVPQQPALPPEEASNKAEGSPKTSSSRETLTKEISVHGQQEVKPCLNDASNTVLCGILLYYMVQAYMICVLSDNIIQNNENSISLKILDR